jgi:multiple sugar transport system permease protein
VIELIIVTLGALWIAIPVVWIISTSLRKPIDAFAFPPKLFAPLTLDNFRSLGANGFYPALMHSIIVVAACVVASLVLGLPAGYALSRGQFRGKQFIGLFLLASYAAPAAIFIFPLFQIFDSVHLIDTFAGLVLAYLTGLLPFTVWMSHGYFDAFPREVEEAALLDGCGHVRVFTRVVLPLSTPMVATVGVLVGLLSWGEYFGAQILTGRNTYTLPVAVSSLIGFNTTNFGQLAAGCVLLVVPPLVLTIVAQRGILSGLTAGAVRG